MMKKFIVLLLLVTSAANSFAMVSFESSSGQGVALLQNQEPQLSKDSKKMIKRLKKEGWLVIAGEKSMEQQILQSQLCDVEQMVDKDGSSTNRYVCHTSVQTAGTFNTAYAAARTNALVELASMLKTDLVAAVESQLSNEQGSDMSATTKSKFSQQARSVVDATIKSAIPVLVIYRKLPNNFFEVQVRLAYDMKKIKL